RVEPAPAVGATPPAGVRLPDTVRAHAYSIELEVDPAKPEFSGHVAIEVELAEPTATIWLNSEGLTIDRAEVAAAGERWEPSLRTSDALVGLTLPAPIGPGPATLELRYRGAASDAASEGLFRRRAGDDWYIYTQLEPQYARRVFPSCDDPRHKVPFQVT